MFLLKWSISQTMVMMMMMMVGCELGAADDYNSEDEQKEYLKTFKYLGSLSVDPDISEMVDDRDMFKKAIENFQLMAGINVTGEVNEETKGFMRLPRCGVADQVKIDAYTRRRKRYALGGTKWDKNHLTYRFNSYTPQLDNGLVERIMRKAFDMWQANSGLTFSKVGGRQPADIIIEFVRGNHGDGNPFDGRGKVLAHAYFPSPGIGGDAHYDEDEHWTDGQTAGTNLLQVAVHELGHSLGLSHSKVKGAIMQAFYQGYNPNTKLHSDDIYGIQALYGRARPRPGPNPTPSTKSPTTPRRGGSSAAHSSLCRIRKVDAICSAGDKILVFSGSKFFLMEGYGRNIRNVEAFEIRKMFLQITTKDIDFATMEAPTNNKGYLRLYSGGQAWKYAYNFQAGTETWNYISLMGGYPRKVGREITGFPSGITAGFTWKQNGNEYYFKGSQYYRKQKQFSWIDSGYPRNIKIWKGIPVGSDAVFSYTPTKREDAATFFLKGNTVYWFNEAIDKVDPRFRNTISTFFGCGSPRAGKLQEEGGASNPNHAPILLTILTLVTALYLTVVNY